MKRLTMIGIVLALTATLAACSGVPGLSIGGGADAATGASALPEPIQLSVGTLMLEETPNAVTAEQAQELLPLWQLLRALQESGTAAQVEIEAVLDQIRAAMTPEQLAAIEEMDLTPENMRAMLQELGFGMSRGEDSTGGQGGGFGPPPGVVPGGGPGRGGGFGLPRGMGAGGGTDLSPEEQEAAVAERMNAFLGTAMMNRIIQLLEARAEGKALEPVAPPNWEMGTSRAIIGAVAEATGMERPAIMEEVRAGKTLAEIAEAHGADVEAIVAQVVAAETERINQAVADGTLDQADADERLAGLEARIRELLTEPLRFGGPGAPADATVQP